MFNKPLSYDFRALAGHRPVQRKLPTKTVENYFSIFKRGMRGTYQHCAHNHLNRYFAEFDFRYNHRSAFKINDSERTDAILAGIVGKRLTYERIAQ